MALHGYEYLGIYYPCPTLRVIDMGMQKRPATTVGGRKHQRGYLHERQLGAYAVSTTTRLLYKYRYWMLCAAACQNEYNQRGKMSTAAVECKQTKHIHRKVSSGQKLSSYLIIAADKSVHPIYRRPCRGQERTTRSSQRPWGKAVVQRCPCIR